MLNIINIDVQNLHIFKNFHIIQVIVIIIVVSIVISIFLLQIKRKKFWKKLKPLSYITTNKYNKINTTN